VTVHEEAFIFDDSSLAVPNNFEGFTGNWFKNDDVRSLTLSCAILLSMSQTALKPSSTLFLQSEIEEHLVSVMRSAYFFAVENEDLISEKHSLKLCPRSQVFATLHLFAMLQVLG